MPWRLLELDDAFGCGWSATLPHRTQIGTPAHRQLSICRRAATYVSTVAFGRDARLVEVTDVLATDRLFARDRLASP